MTIYNYATYNSLCVCGDIHGEFRTLLFNIKRLGIENSVIVVAGDCGIGFEKETYYAQLYNKLSKTLIATNNILLLMRGNHDDPTYFNEDKMDFDRMKCVADYSVVQTARKTVLCIGGAISIDRTYRKNSMATDKIRSRTIKPLYWENEAVVFNEVALKSMRALSIDTIITHTCPSFCYPVAKSGIDSWLEQDRDLASDLDTERKLMDKIYERLKLDHHPLKNWCYGHFHQSYNEFIEGINFSLLTIMEIKEI